MFVYHTSYMIFLYAGKLQMKELSSCALAFVAKCGKNGGDIMYGTPIVGGTLVTMDLFSTKNRWQFNNRAMQHQLIC